MMEGANQPNQSLIPQSEKDIESLLAILLDQVAETNGISLPSLQWAITEPFPNRTVVVLTNFRLRYLTDEGKSLTAEEATLGKRALAIAYDALVRSSASMVNKLAVKLNSTAPVHQLPTEILSEVFCWTLEPDNQYVRTLHQLALVGRRWYSVVKASTELWTTIRVDQRMDDILLILRKSKGRMLRVIVMDPSDSAVLRTVEAESLRWESLEFSGRQYSYGHSTTVGTLPHTPHLRDASFQITPRYYDLKVYLPEGFYEHKLRHVRLSGMAFDWSALLETGLITLDVDDPDTIPAPERLCELLSKCPQLLQFRLEGWGGPMDMSRNDTQPSWTRPRILLPSLTSLELKDLPPQYLLLLSRIDAPNCATVTIGDQNVLLEASLVKEMPPLLFRALVPIFHSSQTTTIHATGRRDQYISLTRQAKQLPIEVVINTPVEKLDVVADWLKSCQAPTPITLHLDEKFALT